MRTSRILNFVLGTFLVAATRGLTAEMVASAQALAQELSGAQNLLVPLDQYLQKG